MAGKSHRRAVSERLTAKNGNRLLQARGALRQVIRGVSDVIHHPRIVVGHCADTGDGGVDKRQRLGLLLRGVADLLNQGGDHDRQLRFGLFHFFHACVDAGDVFLN